MTLSARYRKSLLAVALVAAAGSLALPVSAHDKSEHKKSQWPQATLQAQASAEVQQDTVRITLAAELSDASQAAVAERLSKTLEDVMADAKGHDKIKATSGNYRVWPKNDQDGKISDWRGRGEIILESSDFAAASQLASDLSDRMPIANLDFSVSPKARAEQEAALLAEAAQAFKDRARELSQAFGYADYAIKEVNLSGAGARYYDAAPRGVAMAAAKAAVPLEAGTETVSVSVQGSIFLRSAQK